MEQRLATSSTIVERGARADSDITIYKAMGVAMEDMVAANLAYRTALRSLGGSAIAM